MNVDDEAPLFLVAIFYRGEFHRLKRHWTMADALQRVAKVEQEPEMSAYVLPDDLPEMYECESGAAATRALCRAYPEARYVEQDSEEIPF